MQNMRGRVASGEGVGIPEAARVELALDATERDRQGDDEKNRCIASQRYRAGSNLGGHAVKAVEN